MSSRLQDMALLDLLPGSIAGDAQMVGAARACDAVLRPTSLALSNLLILARLWGQPTATMAAPLARLTAARGGLKPLSLAELEQLAWQFHVDFREVAATEAQLAAMVRQSIAWHRIKGTPASIKAALQLFGYEAELEENGPGRWWATYQLGLPELASLEDVRRMATICKEMAPARSRLWRVYAGFDRRPIVLTDGPALSEGWLSYYSGTPVGMDDGDSVLVSFGRRTGVQAEQLYPGTESAALQTSQTLGSLCPYIDRFVLSYSRLGETYSANHGFVAGQIVSLIWAELTASGWDRPLPPWRINRVRRVARSQMVLSCPPDGRGTGTLGDSNARLGRTCATTYDGWGALSAYCLSGAVGRKQVELTEMLHQHEVLGVAPVGVGQAAPCAAVFGLTASASAPLHKTSWGGPWRREPWWPYLGQVNITSIQE